MEIVTPVIRKISLKEYLKKDINKAAYDFYHEYLKPKYDVKIEDFQQFLEETYTLLGIIYFNYSETPYSVKEYFDKLNETKLKKNNNIINAFQYAIIWSRWVAINASYDERPNLVDFSKFGFLGLYYPLADKEARKITGQKIDFVNEDLDQFYGYFENENEFGHISEYKKILDFLHYLFPQVNLEQKPTIESKKPAKVKNNLTQSELLELIKALKLTGRIEGNNKDIIRAFAQFFSVEIKNPDQIINGFKGRNNGRETLFLDELKNALFNYTQH